MVFDQLNEYLAAAKAVIDIFRGIRAELPEGKAFDDIRQHIETAEKALALSEAELAKELGFRLCRCTWPPQIMLWEKEEKASFCPKCRDRYPPPQPEVIQDDGSWAGSRIE